MKLCQAILNRFFSNTYTRLNDDFKVLTSGIELIRLYNFKLLM
jgi:hypothetical protein